MKNKTVLITLITLISLLAIPSIITNAGHNNHNTIENGKSVERGTGKLNGHEGCNPGDHTPSVWIWLDVPLPPWITSDIWLGAPCCAHKADGPVPGMDVEGEPVYNFNQCCNGPDEGPSGVPGNHCRCFEHRGYPVPNAGSPPT